ncbi:hypothetical protein HDU76_011790, partial [Blyttiomyces sp. JEL0837]
GGNMAKAIIGGLISQGYPKTNIFVSEPIEAVLTQLSSTLGVHTSTDNNNAVLFKTPNSTSSKPADVVILSVKPQVLKVVAEGLTAAVQSAKPVIITIAAGVRVDDLARWLCADPVTHAPVSGAVKPAIVRVMPNTPALVSEGASGLWAPENVPQKQLDLAFSIVNAFSKKAFWLDKESLLDVVTGVS